MKYIYLFLVLFLQIVYSQEINFEKELENLNSEDKIKLIDSYKNEYENYLSKVDDSTKQKVENSLRNSTKVRNLFPSPVPSYVSIGNLTYNNPKMIFCIIYLFLCYLIV